MMYLRETVTFSLPGAEALKDALDSWLQEHLLSGNKISIYQLFYIRPLLRVQKRLATRIYKETLKTRRNSFSFSLTIEEVFAILINLPPAQHQDFLTKTLGDIYQRSLNFDRFIDRL
jgi:hypothetical protein